MNRILAGTRACLLFAAAAALAATSLFAADADQPKQVRPPKARASAKTTARKGTASPRLSAAGHKALSLSGTQSDGSGAGLQTSVTDAPPHPVPAVRTRPLRELPVIPPPRRGEERERIPEPVRPPPPGNTGEPDTTPTQALPGPIVSAPTASGLNFDGVGIGLGSFVPSNNPPDTNGRVGATQYVQWNNTSFAIFDKTTGAVQYGPAAGNTLFQSLGGACATHNDGDPVVVYDILAGRWLLSQFVVGASPSFSHQCVAVSVTGDATGSYFLYDFVTDAVNFVDYPHIGVWPDGYYMSAHVFNAAGTAQVAGRIYVFERDKMLLGQPARQLSADLKKYSNRFQYGFLPSDLDSLTPPPAGEAAFVIGPDPAFTNRLDSTRVAVTWGVTPSIALTETNITASWGVAPCASNTAAQDNRDCVPQPSPALATDDLDNLAQHVMYRLPYRNFGGSPVQESLVANITVAGSTSPSPRAAIRWYEFRNAGSSTTTPTVFQASTFDPDTNWRWMGSIAMDKDHDIALGYSKSSTSVLPSIWINGRLGTDPINTLGSETEMQAGGGVQLANAGNRWGDYSAITLDPIDQCTFWYTNEYLKSNGIFNWSTRIAAFKYPSCTPANAWGTVTGTITSCATGVPLSGVVVTLSNGFAGATNASGVYSIPVPPGSYTATAADADRNCATASPASAGVIVSSGGTATQNFCMTGASNLQFNSLAIDDSVNGNNNGVINRNECVNLNLTVKNNGCANESAVSATLTTATTGVTVTQGSSTYPNLPIDASGVNDTAFKIQTSNAFVCGTILNFTLHLTYASGSKDVGFSVPTCTGGPDQSIPTSSIALTDPSQTDRMGRDGVPSTCSGKTCPAGIGSAGTRNYRTFNFTNSGGAPACITVQLNAACGSGGSAGDIESVAYLNTYNPANLCANYLGDSGISGLGTTVAGVSYSFTVPASSNFVVVVNTNTGSTTCAQFSGLVSGFFDFTAGPGACPACIPPATPTINAGGSTTFCAGGSVTLTSSSATGNQWYLNGNAINAATGNTYNATASGNYTVTTTVAGCTSAPSAPTNVTVNSAATPTITPGGPTTFCAGGSVTLTSSSASSYQWYLNASPIGSGVNQQYVANASGNYTVIVTDGNGCTSAASAPTSVTVNPIPATPTASNGGPYGTGDTIALSTPAVGGASYLWSGPNSFTSTLRTPTIPNATLAQAGTYSVTITVSGCTSLPGTTNVVVTQVNHPPVLSPIGNKTVAEGSLLTFTVSATDSDGDTLTYSATNVPAGAVFDPSTRTFTWTPGFDAAGPYMVTFDVSDGHGGTDSETITITVTDTNRPPVLGTIGNRTVAAGALLTFTASATDPDGDTVTYAVTNLPTGASFSTTSGAFSWTPTTGQIGYYNLTFTANDGRGGSDSEAITITVTGVNPSFVVATPLPSSTNVDVSWFPSTGAVSYRILRRQAGEGFGLVGTSSSLGFQDTTAAANTAYLYIVRGVDASNTESPDSLPDLATTVIFDDDPIVPATTMVKAIHFDQMRTAVNAVRALAGLSTATFTDASLTGVVIKKVHVEELRSALNSARSTLTLPAVTYTDATLLTTTPVKAVHLTDLRNGVK